MTDKTYISRIEYLTEYLFDRLSETFDGTGDFLIRTGPNEFAWVGPEDQEVTLVQLQPARFTTGEAR